MKLLLVLLGLSLAGNVWLAFSSSPSAAELPAPTPLARPSASAAEAVLKPVPEHAWSQIDAGGPEGVAALRAAGLPEHLIRAIVVHRINELFRHRELALYPDPARLPYWKRSYRLVPTDRMKALDLRREKQAMLEQLVGKASETDLMFGNRYSFLPPAKAESLSALLDDYSAMEAKIRGDGGLTTRLKSDRDQLAYLQQEKRREMSELLTPAELEAYDLRHSTTASRIKSIRGFSATEEEYRKIFELQRPFDDQFNNFALGPIEPGMMERRRTAQAELDAQLKTALGEKRFTDYKRTQDYEYQTLERIRARLNLSTEKVNEAYALQKEYTDKARAVAREGGDVAQRTASLRTEAEERLAAVLGKQGLEAYQHYGNLFRTMNARSSASAVAPVIIR